MTETYRIIDDETGESRDIACLEYDATTGALVGVVTPLEHARVHDGNLFHASVYAGLIEAAGSTGLAFSVGDADAHVRLGVSSAGNFQIELLDEFACSDNGAAVASSNMHRGSASTAGMAVYLNPVVTGSSLVSDDLVPAGRGSVLDLRDSEWILESSGSYALRATNVDSSGSAAIGLSVEWYEV